MTTRQIRVRGIVQGVGFRPTVWRIARRHGLAGWVKNDSFGVLIHVCGQPRHIEAFCEDLRNCQPPLARIDDIEMAEVEAVEDFAGFQIVESTQGETRTLVAPDAAVCQACRQEIFTKDERRFRYPFTNCTHCGPRFSIINAAPYDRANTTMVGFQLCDACDRDYRDPSDRRFHAQPIACPSCGPTVKLSRLAPGALPAKLGSGSDEISLAAQLLVNGAIVAIKGLGGFHLACDATNSDAVSQLRDCKQRYAKPFALMARDIDVVRRYCRVDEVEEALLQSPESPIVLLKTRGENLPAQVAPGMGTLGFMLPYTPLHLLLMESVDRPLVMTSGNLSDEPQIIDNVEANTKLGEIADYALFHNRNIANRIDDSVVQIVAGSPRVLRRARGYAPSAILLPSGFERSPDLLAMGGELKAAFCLLKDGVAVLSQHQGDLEEVATFDDYHKNLRLYTELYDHEPTVIAADMHPEYLSSKLAAEMSVQSCTPLELVQHHHAHIAACLTENKVALEDGPVLGIALDGFGYGEDATLWGGEFLLADYRAYKRLATFKPVPMLGGAQAVREPWRLLYAHVSGGPGWQEVLTDFADLEIIQFLQKKPLAILDSMQAQGINAPLATSCGRLFDAVSAAAGLCRDEAQFEGQGAMLLEANVSPETIDPDQERERYPFNVVKSDIHELPYLDSTPMWLALFADLKANVPAAQIAARFHNGLIHAIVGVSLVLWKDEEIRSFSRVALSGGCFQNAILLEAIKRQLEKEGFDVLTHASVPANDGGLAIGQAAIAAARTIKTRSSKI